MSDEAIPDEPDVIYYPVKSGDWITCKGDPGRVAKIRSVYHDYYKNDENGKPVILVDLYVYDRSGVRVGRESPALGGPRKFEPACEYIGWERIEEPLWPIRIRNVPNPDKPGSSTVTYHHGAKVLPDRKWARKVRRYTAPVASKPSDYDPDLEAHSRRMAAQELRGLAREARGDVVDMLKKRAIELERQADAIKPRV